MMVSACWRLLGAALAGILFLHGFCFANKPLFTSPNYTFVQEATKAPIISYYDYIIVGGGTAGCPLAATLSKKANVLVLERGGNPYGNPLVAKAAYFGAALMDLSPSSPAQLFISQDGVLSARARVLGGGTAINAGIYSRAEAEFVKEAGWDEKLVNQSFRWVEDVVVFKPELKQWQSAFRDGLLEVGVVPYHGFTMDHLIGTKVTGRIFDANGYRHSAADFLEYGNSNRLSVLLNATVHRILFKTKGKSRPTAHGVVFTDASGVKHKAYLKGGSQNEIILSAGALASPQLLMLSGVGPKKELQAHNITVVLDQPSVGQGMADCPLNGIFVPSPSPVEVSIDEVVGITRFGSYIEGGCGFNLLAAQPNEYQGFSPEKSGFIYQKVGRPRSKGYLELRTRNPNDNPAVTFNYFKDPMDLEICVEGLTTILKTIESKAFSKFRYANISVPMLLNITANFRQNFPVTANTTKSLQQFCKDTQRTLWHYHGGCQVGRVVDHHYKVLGVDALRVIDGSTFTSSPGTNPQATVMMLGRYMGIKILKERSK